jgi:hypothetical protein
VTLPPSDARPSRALPRRPHFQPLPTPTTPPFYSTPVPVPTQTPFEPQPMLPQKSVAAPSFPEEVVQDRAFGFASHSWDLASGGLKTLTAKREFPAPPKRRPTDNLLDTPNVPRSYMLMLIILVCVLLMLISGGIVLFVILQP